MRLKWSELGKKAKLPVAGLALGLIVLGAYWMGGRQATAADGVAVAAEPAQRSKEDIKESDAPVKVTVPRSTSGAHASGVGGESWMSGDQGRLSRGFKDAVSSQVSGGTLGQAQRAMAGMGFSCALGASGRMECLKELKADNCTLTWSVRLENRGGNVGGAGGEGFSRECS
jgi:hypothetical protein